jgi:hypothetical protein
LGGSRPKITHIHLLSKRVLHGRGTIEIKRNQKGELFFATRNADGFATWHLYPTGEQWLNQQGYVVGDKIDLTVVTYLHRHGMSYTGGAESNPASHPQKNPIQQQDGNNGTSGGYDWAASVGLDKRLGNIRADTRTIYPDGSVVQGASPTHCEPNHRRSTASSRAADFGPHTRRESQSDLARLWRETERFKEQQKHERRRSKQNPLSPVHIVSPAKTPPSNAMEPRTPKQSVSPSPVASTTTLRAELQKAVAAEHTTIHAIMKKLHAQQDEGATFETRLPQTGVPKKLAKKAARRQKKR